MKITLTNSPLPVFVDAADYPMLAAYSWALVVKRNKHYAIGMVKKRRVYMHRFIMGEPLGKLVDHKDGEVITEKGDIIALNNFRSNLRVCTRSQNMGNQKAHADRKGKYKGVCREIVDGKPGRYIAQICIKGKTRKLGRFDTAAGAAMVYDEAALRLFGEFAKTNFQNERKADRSPLTKTVNDTLTFELPMTPGTDGRSGDSCPASCSAVRSESFKSPMKQGQNKMRFLLNNLTDGLFSW